MRHSIVHLHPESIPNSQLPFKFDDDLLIRTLLGMQKLISSSSLCRSVQHELEQDSSDKFRALQLDQLAHQLRNSSANIALYGDIEKLEKWMSVPEKWAEHTSANLKRSQAERAASRSIREAIEHCLGATFSKIRDLWSSSNACLSQRIQETMEAKNRIQINQELFDVEKNMEYLKRCIADKQAPLKVARTRLDLRNRRPNIELCHDDPHERHIVNIEEAYAFHVPPEEPVHG
ncbi:unnamed protein product, partial [Schistosoma mattheei]